ncbi:uncharacterized protein FTOL_02402 [Fusarium torulosum]|uniref:Uncharacterized protein n=1 Tax=Fusarium torulosum TaxID=33205 RepID=A0AAE8SED5_9HYPO|nr:uncharacterized protein FTOL_02402 [Fusarium torulosum]
MRRISKKVGEVIIRFGIAATSDILKVEAEAESHKNNIRLYKIFCDDLISLRNGSDNTPLRRFLQETTPSSCHRYLMWLYSSTEHNVLNQPAVHEATLHLSSVLDHFVFNGWALWAKEYMPKSKQTSCTKLRGKSSYAINSSYRNITTNQYSEGFYKDVVDNAAGSLAIQQLTLPGDPAQLTLAAVAGKALGAVTLFAKQLYYRRSIVVEKGA